MVWLQKLGEWICHFTEVDKTEGRILCMEMAFKLLNLKA